MVGYDQNFLSNSFTEYAGTLKIKDLARTKLKNYRNRSIGD